MEEVTLHAFRRLRASGDPALRDRLTCRHMPLVGHLARRFARPGVPLEDLVQVGYVGLINAVDHFDPDRRVKFETYARHMIAGEIRHYLRDHAASIRRPRWLGTLNQRIARAVGTLHQRLGRPPTLREICGEAGVTEDTLLEVLKAREALRVLSLDENGDDGEGGMGPAWERTAGYEGSAAQPALDDRIVLMEAMDRLKPMQQRVLFWLFYRDLTQTEVAARLRISQKHVSRVMHAAIRNLKSILREE